MSVVITKPQASRPDQPGDHDQSIRKLAGHYWICMCEHYEQSHAQHYLSALKLAMSWKLVPLLLAGMVLQDDAEELQVRAGGCEH